MSEINRLITKIANPVPNEKDEHANHCAHATEDVSIELRKMKGSKAKIINNNASEIDSCGLPQVADDSMIDEQLSNALRKEISNCSYSNVRKMMQEGNIIVMSRYPLINKKNDTSHEGFTMK